MKNKIIATNIQKAFSDPSAIEKSTKDFAGTFMDIGMNTQDAESLSKAIIEKLATVNDFNLDEVEKEASVIMRSQTVNGKSFADILIEKVRGRSDLVFDQVKKYFTGITGKVIDFGCGDGKITQLLHDDLGLDVIGYDVVLYPLPEVTVPVLEFNGSSVPVEDNAFEAALVTNVIHHEAHNEVVIKELSRIVSKRLVIIETVPEPSKEEDVVHECRRVFMNDYLYNRIFHYGDQVPVPGTYETPAGWAKRFESYGWKTVTSIDLGIDQKVIRDRHHLFVFER